jgi:hypothetical protein
LDSNWKMSALSNWIPTGFQLDRLGLFDRKCTGYM